MHKGGDNFPQKLDEHFQKKLQCGRKCYSQTKGGEHGKETQKGSAQKVGENDLAGFFGNDWSVDAGDFAWREP